MDATSPQKKLEFIFIHHNLYGAKERIFETFGEIKKVWALSNFITPETSSIHINNSGNSDLRASLSVPEVSVYNNVLFLN